MQKGNLRKEIERKDKQCCGTCRHCRGSEETGDWICTNDLSDNYAVEVEYDYWCEDYEERE